MARRSIDDEITELEAERDRLKVKIEEAEAYKVLIAQGNRGSETHFTDLEVHHARMSAIYNRLETLYGYKGV